MFRLTFPYLSGSGFRLKKYLWTYGFALVLALVFLGHAGRIYKIPLLPSIDAFVYDARLRLTTKGGVDERIVIVDIDEKSLAKVGRWPWNRAKMAELVNLMFEHYDAKVLGFDVIFAEPDTSSGLQLVERLAKTGQLDEVACLAPIERMRDSLDYDRLFARSLMHRPVVLAYSFTNEADVQQSGMLPQPAVTEGTFRNAGFYRWTGYGANLAEFQRNAASAGHINPIEDVDGESRRVGLLMSFGGNFYESFSLALARLYLGNPLIGAENAEKALDSNAEDGRVQTLELYTDKRVLQIPVDWQGASLIPFRGPEQSFRYLSALDVLSKKVDIDKLKGKIVLVGTTAPGLVDLRSTPVGNAFPGVEIHANMLAGIIDGTIKRQDTQQLIAVEMALIAAFALLFGGGLPLLTPLAAHVITLTTILGLAGFDVWLWNLGYSLPLAALCSLILLLYFGNIAWGYFVVSRSKNLISALFGQYVPPELVDKMAEDPDLYSMEGRNEELTVVFSDIRGFTAIAENLDPKELSRLMNAYLEAMTNVIREHGGTLDKFIGDAIMAFWGAPVADPDHATHAVQAAIAMQKALPALNAAFQARGWPALKIGIGINSGTMTVGDMGSSIRRSYTVMGDAVNLGSRLESLSKYYDVGMIAGGRTQFLAPNLVFREIDRVRVVGKEQSVPIFEPVGAAAQLTEEDREELSAWAEALRLFRTRDWSASVSAFGLMLKRYPEKRLYRLYLQRAQDFAANPPNETWDGVTNHETK